MAQPNCSQTYWNRNLIYLKRILFVWGIILFGFSILGVNLLNHIKIGRLPLGFWFGQQGALFMFIGLIFCYAISMDRLDAEYHRTAHEHSIPPSVPEK